MHVCFRSITGYLKIPTQIQNFKCTFLASSGSERRSVKFSGRTGQAEMTIPEFRTVVEPSRKKLRTASIGGNCPEVDAANDHSHHDPTLSIQKQLDLQYQKTPILQRNFGLTWFSALEDEFRKDYFQSLSDFVTNERSRGSVYPPADQVFTWTLHFPIEKTKVVILGQDPYHGPGQAHGLAFSVVQGVKKPSSLVNIFKEMEADIPGTKCPSHGDLTAWAQQGVLLLNACLTVRAGAANSHKGRGWEELTDSVIRWLNDNLKGVVFLLWGKYAQLKGSKIDHNRHHVLTSGHPSGLSVRYFTGCRHFSKTNHLLQQEGKDPVEWGRLN